MTNEPERWRCSRCTMGFRVQEAPSATTERQRCPDCGIAFWSNQPGRAPARIIVGIHPQELAA